MTMGQEHSGHKDRKAEPPPLPSTNDQFHDLRIAGLAIGSVALVLLLLIMYFMRSLPKLEIPNSAPGNGSSGVATGTSGGTVRGTAAGSESISERKSEAAHATVGRDTSADQISNEVNAGVNGATNANQNQTVEHDQNGPTGSSSTEPVEASEFFTLGSRQDNSSRPNVTDIPSGTVQTGVAFTGRSGREKSKLLQDQGGTAVTEAAVKLGLEWLARNQLPNGLWSLNGPFENGSPMENKAAATAMALLAFQGAGHTHNGESDDPFTRVVSKGSDALVKLAFDREAADEELGQAGGYSQALTTMAICELYGMTHDRKLRKPSFQAVEYCVGAQSNQGGWRYRPNQDSDTSVTGWFLMGLQSARMSGLKVPQDVFAKVSSYLDGVADSRGSRYSYQPGLPSRQSMTAEALLCRQYLGWRRDDRRLQEGTNALMLQLPSWQPGNRNVYYWYYATQVCHHMGGDYWQRWNSVMREVLPANQVRDGSERGSWDPRGDEYGLPGGRLYVTCLSLYTLEVYYRYLPLYQESAVNKK